MTKVSDLFRLDYGHSLELNRLEPRSGAGAVAFVGRAARNNGVTTRVAPLPDIAPAPAGTISVALGGQGGAGVAFLQPRPYYCGRDVMILTAKEPMTEPEKLWWVACITLNRFRFGFGRQANRTLKDLDLPRPADMPTWVALIDPDRYSGTERPAAPATVAPRPVDLWRPFVLRDLFEVRKGQRLTRAAMRRGPIPYVGASDRANGVTAHIGQAPIHAGGTISVSYNGSVAEAFYQPEPYWATDDVNVLYPRGFLLTPAAALFVCAILRREKYRFNYGRKWHLERMRESVIKLPATEADEPDWRYMETYIQSLPYSSQCRTGGA